MTLDVETGGDGVYFLVHPRTRGICGHIQDEGDGWWTGVYASHSKRFFCPARTSRPELDAAEQLTGT